MQEREKYRQQVEINSIHLNPYVLEFNAALKNNPQLFDLIREVAERRPNLTPLHFGLLVQAACQYIWLEYLEKWKLAEGEENWEDLLPQIIEGHFKEIVSLCSSKNVAITVPERYFALKAAIRALFDSQPVVIFDVGAGFVPRGMGVLFENRTEFCPQIASPGSKELVEPLLKKPISIKRAVCVDVQTPDSKWTAACYWYPLDELKVLEESFEKEATFFSPNLEFRLFDITCADSKPVADLEKKVDIVMMSNLFYQLDQEERQRAIENVIKLLRPKGKFLSLEYLPRGSRRRPFTFGAQIYEKTNTESLSLPQDMFRLDSADCKKIQLGQDFREICQLVAVER